MKLSTSVAAALTVLASTASSAAVNTKFYLVLESSNSNLNGTALITCHEGAAIEALCKGKPISESNPKFSTFKFKEASPNYGEVTFFEDKLTGGKLPIPISLDPSLTHSKDVQSLGFLHYNKTSNVLFPLFGDGKVEDFSFDSKDQLYIDRDEAVGSAQYYWYMCKQTFESYTYNVLSWVVGGTNPDNDTCQKVNVKRVYA